jgi:hypothetical protein
MKTSQNLTFVLLSALTILLTQEQLSAGFVVTSVTPTTNMGSGFTTQLVNTVNGIGLVGGVPSLTALHNPTIPTNSWVSTAGTLTGFVDFAFATTQLLDGFSFWNQNAGGPGTLGSTGIRDVSITSSLDGVNYFPVSGAPASFLRITSAAVVGPQLISFAPISARNVRFNILSNYGDTAQTGFAEAQFSAIPEPATGGFGFAVLAAVVGSWRRRGTVHRPI